MSVRSGRNVHFLNDESLSLNPQLANFADS